MQILSRCFIIICVRGCSLSRLERFAHIEEVGGSSPSIPTISPRALYRSRRSFFAKTTARAFCRGAASTRNPLPRVAGWLLVRICPPAFLFRQHKQKTKKTRHFDAAGIGIAVLVFLFSKRPNKEPPAGIGHTAGRFAVGSNLPARRSPIILRIIDLQSISFR